jgi:putative Mn2+ efflux pump MntP
VDLLTVLLIAVGLAMDAFAVSLAVSAALGRVMPRQAFRLSFHFGLFQFLMPLVGFFSGGLLGSLFKAVDHWIALALLCWVGGGMLLSGIRGEERFSGENDPTRKGSLVMLSVATSIDALAVGFTLALLGVSIWTPAVIIGVVAALFTLLGIYLGARLGRIVGRSAELIGGLVLIGIGLRVLISHLTAG